MTTTDDDATPTGAEVHVPILARVEGEGALHVAVHGGAITDLRLQIYEPPRFFEGFLRGRGFGEPVDLTARICGICPVAYQMSATHALERIADVQVPTPIRELRRLLYCGEWIESHVLHVAFLHAPDFLGLPSGIAIAEQHPELVRRVLELKRIGNELVEIVGGRPIHPVNPRLGGFWRTPSFERLRALRPSLDDAAVHAEELLRWVATFDFPAIEHDHEFVSLRHPDEYPMNEGRIVSNRGLDIDVADFELVSREVQVPHSTALHSYLIDRSGRPRPYHVGPLARWANDRDLLPARVRDLAADVGLRRVERNPFRSVLVRAIEVVYAIDEARRIIDTCAEPEAAAVDVTPCAGEGWGCTEAPRGILYHRYRTADDGTILEARIVPPTAQNQPTIEADVRRVVEQWLATGEPSDVLQARCEHVIRSYDPCISCSTHFLRIELVRS
ncbi:MAG: nickel-dependent hydrogenase large subunit [Acidimicrobiales bacterium]